MLFRDLNVGDVFKLIKGDTTFIKINAVNDNVGYPIKKYNNYPSNVFSIDKLHYGVISPRAEVYRIKEYHGQEQEKVPLKELYNKYCRSSTLFRDLNVGDIFKIPTQDTIYIKIAPASDGRSIMLTGNKQGESVYFIHDTSVEIIRDLNDVPAKCCAASTKMNSHNDTLLSCGVTYTWHDCETTWKMLNDMGNVVKKVIFNDPATIVIWGDGSKTVVKCQNGEKFDKEKGLALCYMKKMLGNKSNFNNVFKEWIKPEVTAFYDEQRPELGIQDLPPKNKMYPANVVRIKDADLKFIHRYMRDNGITYQHISNVSGLHIDTVKRALTSCPVLKNTVMKICEYFDFTIHTTRYSYYKIRRGLRYD